ncbi:hypothetical protein L1887_51426 [Cichorium endivia]|nr:hypothetical protein L1887_51426 [Cichorium endivia]
MAEERERRDARDLRSLNTLVLSLTTLVLPRVCRSGIYDLVKKILHYRQIINPVATDFGKRRLNAIRNSQFSIRKAETLSQLRHKMKEPDAHDTWSVVPELSQRGSTIYYHKLVFTREQGDEKASELDCPASQRDGSSFSRCMILPSHITVADHSIICKQTWMNPAVQDSKTPAVLAKSSHLPIAQIIEPTISEPRTNMKCDLEYLRHHNL